MDETIIEVVPPVIETAPVAPPVVVVPAQENGLDQNVLELQTKMEKMKKELEEKSKDLHRFKTEKNQKETELAAQKEKELIEQGKYKEVLEQREAELETVRKEKLDMVQQVKNVSLQNLAAANNLFSYAPDVLSKFATFDEKGNLSNGAELIEKVKTDPDLRNLIIQAKTTPNTTTANGGTPLTPRPGGTPTIMDEFDMINNDPYLKNRIMGVN